MPLYFDEVYFRKNVLQHTVGMYGPEASEFNGCKTAFVEGNVVGVGPLRPFSYRSHYTETMKTGGNYSWEGKAQLAADFDVQTSKPDDLPISPDDIWLV